MEILKEKSTGYLTITFLDKDELEDAPDDATYRIDGVALGSEDALTEILTDTPLGAGSSVELTLTPVFNTLLDQANEFERRVVTIKATYSGAQAVNDEYEYLVENLAKVT